MVKAIQEERSLFKAVEKSPPFNLLIKYVEIKIVSKSDSILTFVIIQAILSQVESTQAVSRPTHSKHRFELFVLPNLVY